MLDVANENRVALCADLNDPSNWLAVRLWNAEMVCCITPFPCSRFLFRNNDEH